MNARDQDLCGHAVQFYVDDSYLLDGLSRIVGASLGAGDAAVVIATMAHARGLTTRLQECGLDLDSAIHQGRYVSLDANATLDSFMVDGWPDTKRFIASVGGVIARAAANARGTRPRVTTFGEMVALLWADGNADAALHLERLWNDLAKTHDFDLHCAYPMSLFPHAKDGPSFSRICAEHSHVTPAESYTSLLDEGDRFREIVMLQQKALALESEVAERARAQEALERRETELRERNRELYEAITIRDKFLSIAAHELKTPVTGLRGFVQLLLRSARQGREIPPERLETALGAIELQTGKLNQLVSRLLDTTQLEAGTLRICPVETDLVKLIHSALAQQSSETSHVWTFEGPDRCDAMVDPIRLEQAVTNLLDNAVKFSPHGSAINIRLEHDIDGQIQLSVTDHGVGVPAEHREAIFDRFHQAHGAGHLSGMGLGLYISREIVEQHGGSLRLEELQHAGSRFVISLPALRE